MMGAAAVQPVSAAAVRKVAATVAALDHVAHAAESAVAGAVAVAAPQPGVVRKMKSLLRQPER